MVPNSARLLQAIQRLVKLTYHRLPLTVYETWWLLHINRFVEIPLEKGRYCIHLIDDEVMLDS